MNKILERHENADQYDTWFVVKQNYDFDVTKFFIKKIAQFTRTVYNGSFADFILDDPLTSGNKTLSSFRNAKTLIDLNIVTNDMTMKSPKYRNYDIPKSILDSLEDDEKLRVEINKRMLKKRSFVVEKSNKKSNVSKERRIVEMPVYEVFFKILKEMSEKLGSTYITNFEIANFVVLMKDEGEIPDVVEAITLYRAGKLTLNNKIVESRFNKTLNHLIPIKIVSKKNYFDNLKVSEMLDGIIKDTQKLIETQSSDYFKRTTISARNTTMQARWKQSLSNKFDSKCAMCPLSHPTLLRGSHIKSIKECKFENELDSMFDNDNGLLLCANHDALFDKRLISINNEGDIVGNDHGVNTSPINKKYLTNGTKIYLKYHFIKFYELVK